MKIYDGFIFNNELDLLELRLMELDEYVDVFVLVEMGHTFMRSEKPLYFQENAKRFEKWLPKIRHIVVKGYPIEAHPAMEHHQRRMISAGMMDAKPNDVLMMGDVDEIPSTDVLESVRRINPEQPFVCLQKLYYYYVNCEQMQPWAGTVITPRFALGETIDFQDLRDFRHHLPQLQGAGWHFSWLGPVSGLQSKLNSIDVVADAALFNTPEFTKPDAGNVEFLEHCLATGEDIFGRSDDYTRKVFVPIEPGVRQPKAILEWLEKYPQYKGKEIDHDETVPQETVSAAATAESAEG